jgi:hypothetical protein
VLGQACRLSLQELPGAWGCESKAGSRFQWQAGSGVCGEVSTHFTLLSHIESISLHAILHRLRGWVTQ